MKPSEQIKEIATSQMAEFVGWYLKGGVSLKEILAGVKLMVDNFEECRDIAYLRHCGAAYHLNNPDDGFLARVLSSKLIPEAERFSALKELEEHRSPKPKAKRTTKPTKLYLMRNERNGLFKIGRSKDPLKRASTLQSEEPEVTLLFQCPGINGDEDDLHTLYSAKRVRGEWFRLTSEDIEVVLKFMQGRVAA